MHFDSLDKYDNQILEILQADARMSFSDVGSSVGLSRTAVKNRIQSLEEKGYIKGYTAIVNGWQADENVTFLLDIETTPEKFKDVTAKLSREKAIRKVYVLTGECRLHAVGCVSSQLSLRAYFKSLYKDLDGVSRMVCHTVLDVIKDDAGIAFEEIGGEKENDLY